MPYLKLSTNVTIQADQSPKLLADFSKLLSRETGKPERYVMIELMGDQVMLFGGTSEPLAYVECKSIGLSVSQAQSMASSITAVLVSSLSLSADRVYIEFTNCSAEFWAWNGSTFA